MNQVPLSRRSALGSLAVAASVGMLKPIRAQEASAARAKSWIEIRGIYGGFPKQFLERGETPADYGVNAIWVGSGSLDPKEIERYHKLGVKVFAEFNSMHSAAFLK